jgi:SAM-dependent methyltransferase
VTVSGGDACPGCGCRQIRTLCHGSDRLFGTTEKGFLVVECLGCRMVRLYPWPTPEELHTYYPENYWFDPGADTADRLAETWRRIALRDHVHFARRALEESGAEGPVLDVGCGGGLFLRELGLPESRVVGLDFSIDAASVAWGTNGVPAVCGALPRAPFPAGRFALITMFHVLEHLYDPPAYLENARRLLKKNGRLIVQVPNAGCWQFLLFGEKWNGLDVPRHLIDFKEQDLRNLLEYCGFEVVRVKHFSLRDNPAGMASSLAPSLDPMSRRVRRVPESPRGKLFKDCIYFLLVLLALPFTLLEAACRSGSTIMMEARVKEEPSP